MTAPTDLLAQIDTLKGRADEARRRGARAEAAKEQREGVLAQLEADLRTQFGVASWDEAEKLYAELQEQAAAAVERARDTLDREGIA